eukprot:10746.XXX_212322_212561_1 [CDS] Oithona nana genome sequencing.
MWLRFTQITCVEWLVPNNGLPWFTSDGTIPIKYLSHSFLVSNTTKGKSFSSFDIITFNTIFKIKLSVFENCWHFSCICSS